MTGKILWTDLTVEDAKSIAEFYNSVVGWEISSQSVHDYEDYNLHDPDDNSNIVGGICNKKGQNKNIPSQWLNYVQVKNIEKSLLECINKQGKILEKNLKMGNVEVAIIQDPAGAILALVQE